MDYLRIGIWVITGFLVCTWTFGLATNPRSRLKATVVTVMLWWVLLLFPALGAFSVLHMLWLFPLALIVPGGIQGGYVQRTMSHPSLAYLMVGSILPVIGPAIAVAVL